MSGQARLNMGKILSKIPAWLSKMFLIYLITWFCLRVKANGCKNMIWLPEKSGSYFRNHSIQNLTVSSQTMCRVMCYLSDSCLSCNFHQSTSTCEISDSDEFQHHEDLIPRDGYIYTGTKNGCQSNPCTGNKTCQADFTKNGAFNCLCPRSGFTGATCDTDIDECNAGNNNCPAHSTCLNTVGSYQCRCNPGYKKSGQTCLPRKGTKDSPGKSCLSILKTGDSQGTGEYWLDPKNTGNPIKAFCDMTTDGGGWTKVKRLYLQTPEIPPNKLLDTFDSVVAGSQSFSENIIPTGQAMLDILQVMGFHQIHFYCHKKSVGRVVSIMTKNNTAGQRVVRYFTSVGVTLDFPDACGSFDRLQEDTSVLSQNCQRWGKDALGKIEVNKWGSIGRSSIWRICTRPFAIMGAQNEYAFACHNSLDEDGACDDSFVKSLFNRSPLNVNDTWQIAVR